MKTFLSQSEEEQLRKQHRREKNGRVRDRIKSVLLSNKGWSYMEIAEALLLDDETISRHVKEYKEKKKLFLESGGSASNLSISQTEELIDHITTQTYVKVKEICAHVKTKYGVFYTVSGMTSWLRSHGFSYKKPKGTPAKADPEKQAEWLKYYAKLLNTTPEDEPIEFGDGVHPTMATKVSYGWIRTGTDKLISTTASRTRMNRMGSINLENMGVTIAPYETINSLSMDQHFSLLRSKYPTAQRIHLILDRGSYNTSAETKKSAREKGIVLHYLPPYSPNLNPIERLWKIMNEQCRNNRFFTSAKEFRRSIMDFFEITWPKISHDMVDRINDDFQLLKSAL